MPHYYYSAPSETVQQENTIRWRSTNCRESWKTSYPHCLSWYLLNKTYENWRTSNTHIWATLSRSPSLLYSIDSSCNNLNLKNICTKLIPCQGLFRILYLKEQKAEHKNPLNMLKLSKLLASSCPASIAIKLRIKFSKLANQIS